MEFANLPKPTSPCWEWQGERSHNGYARARLNSKHRAVHRFLWEKTRGPVPVGWDVMHLCDNPPCIRLDHLEIGPKDVNIAMKVARNRQAKGEGHGSAKLTREDVLFIFNSEDRGIDLAEAFGISPSSITDIRRGRTWRHVTDPGSEQSGRSESK